MLVDAIGVSFGALMGTITVTTYVESAAGIGEGIIANTLQKVVTGKGKKVHWMMYLLVVLVVTRYVFLSE